MKKPLHKHISHGVRNVHRRVTKYLFERDTFFATIWVFIFIIVLGSIPLNLGFLNPIKLGLKDFDFNDISYAKLGKAGNTPVDKRIVIINIGQADREAISLMIDKAAEMKPKVMGLDVLFDSAKDPYQDSLLSEAFKRNKNLVAARRLVLSGKEGDTVRFAGNYINTASKYAHVNFFTDEMASIRSFEPFEEDYAGHTYNSFSAEIVKEFDAGAFKKLEKKKGHKVIINYTRKVNKYLVINYENLLAGNVADSALEGKIVLFGYINNNRDDIEDKKFTPMNEKYYGKTIPDMNGIVVHANIISMALDKNYIIQLPSWAPWLLAIFVCWLHMSFFIHYYLENHIWFHLAAKIAQVASAILFVWLGIYLFDSFRIKLDMKLSLVVIIMAVDVIYFYEAWATWMHKKYKYRTVFKPHQH